MVGQVVGPVVGLLVDDNGALPLPWLAQPLADALATQRGHALLVHGSVGIGVLPFALTLAQAWLCEGEDLHKSAPCGRCGSCRLVQSHLHPDLQVLMPELLRREHEWLRVEDKAEGDDAKSKTSKPSKQIRIDEVRSVIDRVFKTSGRGRGKVVVLHPAEALNLQSANALLKTLEEPPPGTRILLSCADPAVLLPTVRSRCQFLRLATPALSQATAWLAAQGVAQPDVLLSACSGRPLDALALAQAGVQAEHWRALPAAVAQGQPGALQGCPCRECWTPCTSSVTTPWLRLQVRHCATSRRAASAPQLRCRRWPTGRANSAASPAMTSTPGMRGSCSMHCLQPGHAPCANPL